jgi:hypothetical protein
MSAMMGSEGRHLLSGSSAAARTAIFRTSIGAALFTSDRDPNTCDAPNGLRLLTRSATNTYFPQVARVISLPQNVDELAHRIENFWSVLESCTSVDDVRMARRFNPALKANLEGYTDEEVFSRRQSLFAGGAQTEAAADPRIASCSPAATP